MYEAYYISKSCLLHNVKNKRKMSKIALFFYSSTSSLFCIQHTCLFIYVYVCIMYIYYLPTTSTQQLLLLTTTIVNIICVIFLWMLLLVFITDRNWYFLNVLFTFHKYVYLIYVQFFFMLKYKIFLFNHHQEIIIFFTKQLDIFNAREKKMVW